MKPETSNPLDARLSALLHESRATPSLPPRFQENVWRRIEDAEAPAVTMTWFDALIARVLRPRFALATAAALLVVGAFLGAQNGSHVARQDAQVRYLAAVAPNSLR